MVNTPKILIVDDNHLNMEVLKSFLQEKYKLRTASNGEEALEICSEFRPDLILLDIMMQGLDGYETCRRIRKQSSTKYAKIIMISAKGNLDERLKGYEAGADDYLAKPFNIEELSSKIKVYLKLKSTEEIDELKNNVLRLITHETKTPLHRILMVLELLADQDMVFEERLDLHKIIRESTRGLTLIIEKVIALGQMKSGNFVFTIGEHDLSLIILEAIEKFSEKARNKKIKIKQHFTKVPNIFFDREQIKKVFEFLIDNAVRYSPEKSQITITTTLQDNCIEVKVSDNGPGIDPAFLPQIFEPFCCSDIQHHSEGHGLSLALVQEIIQAHNGEITVETKQKCGSVFQVQIPLQYSPSLSRNFINNSTKYSLNK